MRKLLLFITTLAIFFAAFALAACGGSNAADDDSGGGTETPDDSVPVTIPYVTDFTYDYYSAGGEKIGDRSTAFAPNEEITVKIGFTLTADALAAGKSDFTLRFKPTAGFTGKIVSANSSSTSDADLTATFATGDKAKKCEIGTKITFGYSVGRLGIEYAYDDEEFVLASTSTLKSSKPLKFTYDGATDGYIVEESEEGRWLTGENLTEIVVPAEYDGKPITGLGDYLFAWCSVKSVTLPSTLKSIGNETFKECRSLQRITIPSSVTTIGDQAFYDCVSLTEVILPDGIEDIGNDAFGGCERLAYSTYDKGSYLGSAINEYLYLASVTRGGSKSVTVHENCKVIGRFAFGDLYASGTSTLESVTLPDGLKIIGYGAFGGCGALADMTIPDSVTEFGDNAFLRCEKLYVEDETGYYVGTKSNKYAVLVKGKNVSDVRVKDGCAAVGNEAFYDYESLKTVVLPASVKSIGESAFKNCTQLTSIDMPSVTRIGDSAFFNCSRMESVAIPIGVTRIGQYAFNNCNALKTVVLPEGVTSVGANAFKDCDGLTSVTLPDTLVEIADGTFSECRRLETVIFPSSLKVISTGAFESCNNLETVNLPATLEEIETGAFADCSSLTNVTLPSGLKRFGSRAFANCSTLWNMSFAGTRRAWADILSVSEKYDSGPQFVHCADGDLSFDFNGNLN